MAKKNTKKDAPEKGAPKKPAAKKELTLPEALTELDTAKNAMITLTKANKQLDGENSKLIKELEEMKKSGIVSEELREEIKLEVMEELAAKMAEETETEEAEIVEEEKPKFVVKPTIIEDGKVFVLVNNRNTTRGGYPAPQANALKNIYKSQNIPSILVDIPKELRTDDEHVLLYKGEVQTIQVNRDITEKEVNHAKEKETE